VLDLALVIEARCEQESTLPPRVRWDVCLGWENVWMRWVKTWWTIIIKSCWTCIGNLPPYISLFIYPCIPLTTKHTQKHRVGDSGQYKSYRLILDRFGWNLRWPWGLGLGVDGLVPTLKCGWEDGVYARWHSTPTLMTAVKEEPLLADALQRLEWRCVCVSARLIDVIGVLTSVVKLVQTCNSMMYDCDISW
jgi:hypothetical protein